MLQLRNHSSSSPVIGPDSLLLLSSFLSAGERQQLGRLCKRLIDGGRVHFLKAQGFHGRLSRYVGREVTPENVLLTAVPSS